MDFNSVAPKSQEEYTQMLFNISQSSSIQAAEKKMDEKLYLFIKAEMEKKKISYEDVLKGIKTYLNNIKNIKVYVAFAPSLNLKNQIISFFDYLTSPHIVEVLVDETLIGGAKVSIEGKFFDQSISSKIVKKISTN